MSDVTELCVNSIVELFFSVAVDIAPERRNTVEILAAMHIDQIMALALADDAGLFSHPFLHLGERMPEVSVVEPFELLIVHNARGSKIDLLSSIDNLQPLCHFFENLQRFVDVLV